MPALSLFTGSSRLMLPVRPPSDAVDRLRPHDEPKAAPAPAKTIVQPARTEWTVIRNLASDR
jgi:hypothetical protein